MNITIISKFKKEEITNLNNIDFLYYCTSYILTISNVDFENYKYDASLKIISHNNENNVKIIRMDIYRNDKKIVINFKPTSIRQRNKKCMMEIIINNNRIESNNFIVKARKDKNKKTCSNGNHIKKKCLYNNKNILKDVKAIMKDCDNILSKFNDKQSNNDILKEINNILDKSDKYSYIIKNINEINQNKLNDYLFYETKTNNNNNKNSNLKNANVNYQFEDNIFEDVIDCFKNYVNEINNSYNSFIETNKKTYDDDIEYICDDDLLSFDTHPNYFSNFEFDNDFSENNKRIYDESINIFDEEINYSLFNDTIIY